MDDIPRLARMTETYEAQPIRDYLYSPEAYEKMLGATELGQPAVAGVSGDLLAKWPEWVIHNKHLQYVGMVTRDVCRRNGLIEVATGVPCPKGSLFRVGTRFKHPTTDSDLLPNAMKVEDKITPKPGRRRSSSSTATNDFLERLVVAMTSNEIALLMSLAAVEMTRRAR